MAKQTERIVNADRVDDLIAVFGSFDENIKRIEQALDVQVVNRGTDLRVSGDEEMVDKETYRYTFECDGMEFVIEAWVSTSSTPFSKY